MKIGIDKIGFAMPNLFLDIEDLAIARNFSPNKFTKGLLQKEMSVAPINQDIVTLGASAANEFLTKEDKEKIDMIIIGTETGIDQSKAASIFIHSLLELKPFTRAIEIKEACYGATAALDFAKNHINKNPESYVLVIASDIAKYGVDSSGESTQGAGSCAMLIKKDPSILIINDDNVYHTRDIMDFWRPNYSDFPYVDGHFSSKQYLECLDIVWNEYCNKNNKTLENFNAFCFHLPFPKLGLKGLNTLLHNLDNKEKKDELIKHFNESIIYSQRVGNIYTGSLFLGLLSLLENSLTLKPGDNIALYSYGSGAVCEILTGTLVENFKSSLKKDRINDFNNRKKLSIKEYEEIFFKKLPIDENGNCNISELYTSTTNESFILDSIQEHKRIYKKIK